MGILYQERSSLYHDRIQVFVYVHDMKNQKNEKEYWRYLTFPHKLINISPYIASFFQSRVIMQ